MKHAPLYRAGVYLFLSLCGMLLGGYFPAPYAELIHLLFVLFALLCEHLVQRLTSSDTQKHTARAKKDFSAFLLFPAFFALTLGANLLFAKLTLLFGGEVPVITPSIPLFLGAVLLAPFAEELLFRHLLFSLFSPYGGMRAILFSAVLFALAHGNFYQMPYALLAGILLGIAAMAGRSLLFPLLFHLLYNFCAFWGNADANLLLLCIFAVLSIPTLLLFLRRRTLIFGARKEKPCLREGAILLVYGGVMLCFALSRLL